MSTIDRADLEQYAELIGVELPEDPPVPADEEVKPHLIARVETIVAWKQGPLKNAHRKAMRKAHPDTLGRLGLDNDDANAYAARLNEAHQALEDADVDSFWDVKAADEPEHKPAWTSPEPPPSAWRDQARQHESTGGPAASRPGFRPRRDRESGTCMPPGYDGRRVPQTPPRAPSPGVGTGGGRQPDPWEMDPTNPANQGTYLDPGMTRSGYRHPYAHALASTRDGESGRYFSEETGLEFEYEVKSTLYGIRMPRMRIRRKKE